MQEFNLTLTDKPGELAEVASAVGERGINILGCVGMGRSTASVTMVTDDEEATTKVLKDMGRNFEYFKNKIYRIMGLRDHEHGYF